MNDLLGGERQAKLRFFTSDYEVLTAGSYILCAGTGERIPLAQLKYWCHIRQEAYKDGVVATRVHEERRRGKA